MQPRDPNTHGETLLPDDVHGEPILPDALGGETLLPADVAADAPFDRVAATEQDGVPVGSADAANDASETFTDVDVIEGLRVTTGESDPSASGGSGRTTVLPLVDRSAGRPKLIVAGKRRFEVKRQLGEGGVGEVWLAVDNDIGRKVAIKRIRPQAKSTGAFIRFVQEIQTIGRLEHPNIIPIHDVGRDEHGEYYFVMKFVDGETLESIIAKLRAGDPKYHRRYTFERRVQLFLGLLDAVGFAHSKGVIHRDIKPANVMVGRFGEVLLLDWGIAKVGDRPDTLEGDDEPEEDSPARLTKTRVGAIIGTPAYMSPEQARAEAVDERSDVYALSVVLHELLTLEHYLHDLTTHDALLEGVRERPAPLASMVHSAHQPPVPFDLTWYVRKGLHKDPAQRYASVEEMIERLDLRANGQIPVECPITLTKRTTAMTLGFIDRHPMLVLAMMMLGVLGVLAGAAVGMVTVVGAVLLV